MTSFIGHLIKPTIEDICEHSTKYGILPGLGGHLYRTERSQGHQRDHCEMADNEVLSSSTQKEKLKQLPVKHCINMVSRTAYCRPWDQGLVKSALAHLVTIQTKLHLIKVIATATINTSMWRFVRCQPNYSWRHNPQCPACLWINYQSLLCYQQLKQCHSAMRWFHDVGDLLGVVGCVDGTHIPIKNPGGPNAEIYRNRQGNFSMNVQLTAGANMCIVDIVCRGVEGSMMPRYLKQY
uniref:DDE Tnp4 domain-containing protein n=1 Tax=Timema cristinae TaxID=61476 RepID=A0A7R9D058_TIMCR|nr:unnamed protein product [Timema cristinae]